MPDPKKAEMVETAVQLVLGKTKGTPYEVRKRASVIIGAVRGHKFQVEDAKEDAIGWVCPCSICGQPVRATMEGTEVTGRAVQNDCPAAPWRQPG